MIEATTKPLVMTAGGVETVEPMWRMACEVRGGARQLRAKPYFVMYNQPVSPLKHPFETVDKLLFCADKGIPSTYCPSPIAGGTAPITTAGQVDAGRRRGALRPRHAPAARARARRSSSARAPTRSTWRPRSRSYNSPEFVRAYACEVEMAKWLDLPNWGFSGHTDAQVVDAQAGMEADELTKLSMQLGSNLNHDVGYLDFGLTGSLEELVMVAEFIARDRRLLADIEVSPETLAVDVLVKVGPRRRLPGPAAHARATCARASGARSCSTARATTAGSRPAALDLTEKARQKARELLAGHKAPPLSAELVARLDAIVPEVK